MTPAMILSSFSVVLSGWAVGKVTEINSEKYNQSSLTPPGWVFGVAWSILYAFLGLVIAIANKETRLNIFVNIFVNFSWTFVFQASPEAALAVLAWLLFDVISIFASDRDYRIRTLLLPYITWLSFALYLNAYIVFT